MTKLIAVLGATLSVIGLMSALYYFVARPYQLTLGATPAEIERAMPGDFVHTFELQHVLLVRTGDTHALCAVPGAATAHGYDNIAALVPVPLHTRHHLVRPWIGRDLREDAVGQPLGLETL
jgi:hypothetical protein